MARKNYLMVLLILLLILLCGNVIYAMNSVEVTNRFETGIVDITLKEYEKNGDEEEAWRDHPVILPADTISKIPRIYNNGCDCYVRAGIQIQGIDGIEDNSLLGISADWVRADDGYYYYQKLLAHGEAVDVFQGIRISDHLSKENEGKTFSMDVTVDAIQSKNFTPQFQMAAPWGNVEMIAAKKEGVYDISSFRPSDRQNFQIKYEGKSSTLAVNCDDFFSNFPCLMPGDHYSDRIRFVNEDNENRKLYFRSIPQEASGLSEKIQLKIMTDVSGEKEILYCGALNGNELSEDILLGVLPKGKDAEFEFEISVPPELNNQYSLYSSLVTWIFSTEPINAATGGRIHTGDPAGLLADLTAAGAALILFVVIYRKQKGVRK